MHLEKNIFTGHNIKNSSRRKECTYDTRNSFWVDYFWYFVFYTEPQIVNLTRQV